MLTNCDYVMPQGHFTGLLKKMLSPFAPFLMEDSKALLLDASSKSSSYVFLNINHVSICWHIYNKSFSFLFKIITIKQWLISTACVPIQYILMDISDSLLVQYFFLFHLPSTWSRTKLVQAELVWDSYL